MATELLLQIVLRLNVAGAVAILVVLLLRPLARRLLGPELAYALWVLPVAAAITSLFPTLREFLKWAPRYGEALHTGLPTEAAMIYVAGAAAMLVFFIASEWRFRRLARQGRVGPAVVGLAWPRIVIPSNYEDRFTAAERGLIREHERTHILRRHPRDNRLIAAAQVIGWFNPLVHLAARLARLDQELACDAIVLERLPGSRRLYAETLVKAQGAAPWSAFACPMAQGSHPLEVRVRQMTRPPLSLRRYLAGAGAVGALAVATAAGLWSFTPIAYAVAAPATGAATDG